MTSEQTLMIHAFLPGATQSVPAGKLHLQEEGVALLASRFVYGLKYLKRNGSLRFCQLHEVLRCPKIFLLKTGPGH